MNILCIEPTEVVAHYMLEYLKDILGHTVFDSFNLNDAQTHWENESIDCIISCISLDPKTGDLTDKERKESKNGQIAGWVWIRDHVLKENPEMKNKVILYQAQIGGNPLEDVPEQELRGIHVITHIRARNSGIADKVITALHQIEKSLQED